MKNLAFVYCLLAILFMASCGGKEDRPLPGNDQKSLSMFFSGITVPANYQNVTPPSQTKKLEDVLSSANKDKVPYIKSGDIQYNDSYIMLEGLKAGESLSKLTVKLIDGQSTISTFESGRINVTQDGIPVKDSSNDCMSFLNWVINTLASKKSVTIQIILNGGDVDVSDLKVTVHTTAVFTW